jgi:hypothetical protein
MPDAAPTQDAHLPGHAAGGARPGRRAGASRGPVRSGTGGGGGRAAGSRPSIAGGPPGELSHGGAAEGRAGAVCRGRRRGNRHDRERGPLQAAPGPFAAA